MRILLDENLDWRLSRALSGHDVRSVSTLGWKGTKNGALLRKAIEAGFEVMVTVDLNLSYQHDLSVYPIAVFVLQARTNELKDTAPLMPEVLKALPRALKGKATLISRSG